MNGGKLRNAKGTLANCVFPTSESLKRSKSTIAEIRKILMKKSDYEMREIEGVGWLAHRRRVGTKILILTAVLGTASILVGFYVGNTAVIVSGAGLLLASALLAR